MPGLDFLHQTTYDPEMEQQDDIVNMMASQEATMNDDPNAPENLQEVTDNDINDLMEQNDDEHEEVSDEGGDKLADNTFDYENEEPDEIDYQLMGYLMGDSGQQSGNAAPTRQYGGGTYTGAGTVYGPNDDPTRRLNNIKFASLNRTPSKYSTEALNSAANRDAYNNIHNEAIQTVKNDPIAQKMGITIAQYGAPAGTHSVRYAAGGISPEYNNSATRWQTGGAITGVNTLQQHIGKSRYNFPGMKMPRSPKHLMQTGGDTLYANDDATKRFGLNDQNYQRAVLNLKGSNTIRGLDNHKPVAVTDGSKYRVLHGPHDTDTFKGKVYEKRL